MSAPPLARGVVAALLLTLALAGHAAAHNQPFSYLDLHVRGAQLDGQLTAHIEDLAHEAGLPVADSLRSPAFVEAHRGALEHMLATRLRLEVGSRRLAPRFTAWDEVPAKNALRFQFELPGWEGGPVTIAGPLFPYDPQHETYLNGYEADSLRLQDLLDRRHSRAVFPPSLRQNTGSVVRRFVVEGVHHIFIGPDHILFIIGLLLLGGSLGRLLKIVTAFTLAHSVTLALATLGWVNPPSRVIEPLIALSIAAIGIENLLAPRSGRDLRATLAFSFGFVHGFGFASVLRELALPPGALGTALFAFNVGVEIGQLCIVLAVAPLLALARAKSATLGRRLAIGGSAAVIAAGAFWFVERVFFAT